MNVSRSPTLSLRAKGALACFTRPELKVERVSYPVMTPPAARGLLEAVLWKPAIQWHIEKIKVLKPIRFLAFRRNEVNSKAVSPTQAIIQNGGPGTLYFADADRAQRNTVALRDVDYVVEAHFTFTERKGSDDNVNKFVDMFTRRVVKGQHFHHPYFGCREFIADISTADHAPPPIPEDRELGMMLWDITYQESGNIAEFFPAKLISGVMEIPLNYGKEWAA